MGGVRVIGEADLRIAPKVFRQDWRDLEDLRDCSGKISVGVGLPWREEDVGFWVLLNYYTAR
jgi:hypothetical protein